MKRYIKCSSSDIPYYAEGFNLLPDGGFDVPKSFGNDHTSSSSRMNFQRLKSAVSVINSWTDHTVNISEGIGCYLIIDGNSFYHYIKRGNYSGEYEGITPKQAYLILSRILEAEVYGKSSLG